MQSFDMIPFLWFSSFFGDYYLEDTAYCLAGLTRVCEARKSLNSYYTHACQLPNQNQTQF
jgi:hypothetical protein